MGIKNIAQPGQMVDIGGFRLHALMCGHGSPAVILEPALGGFAFQYKYIQAAVYGYTQVIAYDRAGQGWSDSSPNPRTPANLAGELKALLGKLDLRPPYILVGHSFGGLLTRSYAGQYPDEVAGIVLVDSTHEDEYDPFPNMDTFVRRMAATVRLMKFVSRLGLGKQLAKLSLGPNIHSIAREDLDTFLELSSQPKHHETMLAEFAQYRSFYGAQSTIPRTLGNIPLMVVTAGSSISGQGKIGSLTADQMNELHQKLQKELVKLSPQGDQIIIPGATHFSIFAQPEYAALVADAVRRVVEKAR